MQDSFRYHSFPQEIVFGAGGLAQLAAIVSARAWERVLLVTTRSQRMNGTVGRIEQHLENKLAAVFDATQQHVPQANVDTVVEMAQAHRADVLLALGGGSAIGAAKATSHALAAPDPTSPAISIAAIPTTYAGSEMTPVFGVTRVREGISKKETANDARVLPCVVVYDPRLTLDVPPELTASTGVNAFAHCVEAVYSRTRNPLSTLAAVEAARLIFDALPRCYENGVDLTARTEMLRGSYLAGAALANVAMGLHHGICHVLGGSANVPHGIANAIILPHAIRFNADACAPELVPLAKAVGIGRGDAVEMANALAVGVGEWITAMELPTRLRDAGVQHPDLAKLAELAFANKTVHNNPKPIADSGTLKALLEQAW
jgi:maleylacetate reductase